jgi:hypothetical protein
MLGRGLGFWGMGVLDGKVCSSPSLLPSIYKAYMVLTEQNSGGNSKSNGHGGLCLYSNFPHNF